MVTAISSVNLLSTRKNGMKNTLLIECIHNPVAIIILRYTRSFRMQGTLEPTTSHCHYYYASKIRNIVLKFIYIKNIDLMKLQMQS